MATSEQALEKISSILMPPRHLFEELAASTWEVRFHGDRADMPELPSESRFFFAPLNDGSSLEASLNVLNWLKKLLKCTHSTETPNFHQNSKAPSLSTRAWLRFSRDRGAPTSPY